MFVMYKKITSARERKLFKFLIYESIADFRYLPVACKYSVFLISYCVYASTNLSWLC